MRLGIFAKTFPGSDAASVLAAVRAAGYACTQFNMACVGLPAMPEAIADPVLDGIAEAAAGSGVAVAALSATYNMIHPDPTVRATGLRRLGVMLAAARRLEVGGVHVNETSSSRVDLMPYGGSKDSGFGREGPRYAIHEMTEERIVTFALG